MALLILFMAWIIGGALIGWGVPKLFKSEPPYGLGVDILVSVLAAIILGVPEWLWILPAMGFKGVIALVAAIGDPLGLSLIMLWILRRIKG